LWQVKSPINNYTIVPYIGKYAHFNTIYNGEKGELDMSYWVLEENLAKAKAHFAATAKMMKAFEYWLGPYPFYEDSYKLVEAPYLGMENQSAIAYGNGYKTGYLGEDRSGTGIGLKWDFIIVHESAHEWFGNSITTQDIADMWVHEAFATYSEVLYTDYYYGKEAGNTYCTGLRKNILNDKPIIGTYNVNKEGSADMYDKGAGMIHNIRQVMNNDSLFRKLLRNMDSVFYKQSVTSRQIENFISRESGIDFSTVFDQYLRTTQIPVLEYKFTNNIFSYRWANCITGFNMPLKTNLKKEQWIHPSEKWQEFNLSSKEYNNFSVDANFYINTKKVD
ncbi:MAG: M1 family peptidase, partial [Sphingobacteriales bacterium]|nr:M1 family peptidase [Sphingobacteriales bacterium]